jgi:sugar lactone lactonase YvrE
MNLQPLAPVGDRVGEGIVWVAEEGAAYWGDMVGFLIHRCDLKSGSVKTWSLEEPVAALAVTSRPETLLVALGSRLILWHPETDRRADHPFHLPGWPRVRLNDGRPDPMGNFWVGSMQNNIGPHGEVSEVSEKAGVLYRIAPDGSATGHRRGIGISNTLCWDAEGRRFFFADTLANTIWTYDYDPATATISNEREFFSGFDRGLPDGSAIDSEGCLWNCRYGGSCIVRIAPDGSIDQVVEIPTPLVTTCTFAGRGLTTLLVTTASSPDQAPDGLAGTLFSLDVEVRGVPERRYRLDRPL